MPARMAWAEMIKERMQVIRRLLDECDGDVSEALNDGLISSDEKRNMAFSLNELREAVGDVHGQAYDVARCAKDAAE